MRRSLQLILLLSAPLQTQVANAHQTAAPEPDGGALFLEHCATCHGETGDGDGVTELDRPARSFKDGGFSFGNTPEALYRTISTGIPGSPMPGFDTAIDEVGRRALALYVRSLGPPIEEVDVSAAILEVVERPLVVRGHLPPICEGAQAHPRGLLLGTTSGLTFEYRVDDVRLLGVRQGPFVERQDWGGRGGTPLEPLGPVVHTVHGGTPGPLFDLVDRFGSQPLVAKLRSTWVRAGKAGLTYELLDNAGHSWARVDETVRGIAIAGASGFERSLALDAGPLERGAEWSLDGDLMAPVGNALAWEVAGGGPQGLVRAYRSAEGIVQIVAITGKASIERERVRVRGGRTEKLVVTTIFCARWDAETQAAVSVVMGR